VDKKVVGVFVRFRALLYLYATFIKGLVTSTFSATGFVSKLVEWLIHFNSFSRVTSSASRSQVLN
jgi:hypothetical protein